MSHNDGHFEFVPAGVRCKDCGELVQVNVVDGTPLHLCRVWLENLQAEVARLRKMRTQAQDILGHTVPKNLSPELAEAWAAAIKVLEG